MATLEGSPILTAVAGSAHAVLFILALLLLKRVPGSDATDEEVASFYSSGNERIATLAGLYVMPFAAMAFLWFMSGLRAWAGNFAERRDELLWHLQFGSGIVYLALILVAAGAISVAAATMEFASGSADPDLARSFPVYGSTLMVVLAMKMAAAFVVSTSRLARSSSALPRWFSTLGLAVGAFMLLSATLTTALALVFPIWLFILSGLVVHRARALKLAADTTAGSG